MDKVNEKVGILRIQIIPIVPHNFSQVNQVLLDCRIISFQVRDQFMADAIAEIGPVLIAGILHRIQAMLPADTSTLPPLAAVI